MLTSFLKRILLKAKEKENIAINMHLSHNNANKNYKRILNANEKIANEW